MTRIIMAAVAENGVIGRNNTLPWHFPEDLRMFKRETSGHAVIMGRKTFDSIGRKPLPKRLNIVLSRSPCPSTAPAVIFVRSLTEAFEKCAGYERVFILGGAEVYRQALDVADEMWITRIPGDYEGDAFFPEHPVGAGWELTSREQGETVSFLRYRRVAAAKP